MIEFNCPECNKKIRVKPELAGKTGKCPNCSTKIVVPTSQQIAPDPKAEHQLPPSLPSRKSGNENLLSPTPVTSTARSQPSGPHTAVQVNIQNSHSSNSLGISSLVIGILSLLICWVPIFGFALSGLGLLLGLIGITMSIIRKGTGIGYSIAGCALNGFSLFAGIVFVTIFATAFASVDQAMKQIEAERNKPQPQAKPNITPVPSSNTPENVPDMAANLPSASETPSPPAIVWHSADQPLTLGNVTLRITEISIGKVPLVRSILDQDSASEDDLLTVRLQITNGSTTKKLDYQGWMADFAAITGITAELTDENKNNYRKVTFGALVKVKGASSSDSIYPGKSLDDAIVFELPVENAQKLLLTLSGKGVGEDGEFRFEIPRTMIKQ